VVVIGSASHQGDFAPLVTAGVADFVVRSAEPLPEALGLVEQRLRQAPDLLKIALPPFRSLTTGPRLLARCSGTS
jgi:hypothetical protein